MADLAMELGFDWNIPPIVGVRDGIFPLQVFLVNDDDGTVISSCDPESLATGDILRFRVYDFTNAASGASPSALQVLFTSASTIESQVHFSPIELNNNQLSELVTTDLPEIPPSSSTGLSERTSAFTGSVQAGWEADWEPQLGTPDDLVLTHCGRFKFRAMLTVSIPGDVARFYRVDPEMVIGGDL